MPESFPPSRAYYWNPDSPGEIRRIPYTLSNAGPYWIEQSQRGGLRGYVAYRRHLVESAAIRWLRAEARAARAMSRRCLESADALDGRAAELDTARRDRAGRAVRRPANATE